MSRETSTSATKAPVDEWQALVLSDMLHGLHRYVERKSGIKLRPEQKTELDQVRGSTAGPFSTTLSQAKQFMVDSTESLIGLMMVKGGAVPHGLKQRRLLKNAVRVEKAIVGEEYALGFYLPDFSNGGVTRWPGPVGYRVALNHLVAVSIRLHSIFPSVAYKAVIGVVGRVVVVPILAHNLTFVARTHAQVFKHLLLGLSDLANGREPDLLGDLSEEEIDLYRKWIRLFDCVKHFAPSPKESQSAFREVLGLVSEHGDNPSSSRLWAGLAIFASGDLAIDELLVAKVIKENEELFGSAENRPLVNCARSRFGLLRYSYAMEDQKQLMDGDLDESLESVRNITKNIAGMSRPEHLDESAAREAFGWAYLLSRKILLGRKSEHEAWIKKCREVSKVLDGLLLAISVEKFRKSDNEAARVLGVLALRYRVGFRSNPRFIAETNASDVADYIEAMLKDLKSEPAISSGIVYMVKARNCLHQAFIKRQAGDTRRANNELDHAIAHYGMTLDSVVGHGYKFDKEREKINNVPGVMDGEVAAWCIPEMVMALRMKREMSADRTEKESLRRLSTALAVVGEAKYGIYFNEEEESDRIRRGLLQRCLHKSKLA